MTRRFIYIVCLFFAAPATAQELNFSPYATERCVDFTEDMTAAMTCIGEAANACMEDTPGGYSTVAMTGCLAEELNWWDARLNRVYQQQRADYRAYDADAPEYAPSQAEALRDMQRAWIPFRDAKCALERSFWGGGTGAGPAGVSCLLSETARQVLYLEYGGLGG